MSNTKTVGDTGGWQELTEHVKALQNVGSIYTGTTTSPLPPQRWVSPNSWPQYYPQPIPPPETVLESLISKAIASGEIDEIMVMHLINKHGSDWLIERVKEIEAEMAIRSLEKS